MEHLPTLCLPDQSHNFESDSVYFVLPNQELSDKKIFGMFISILIQWFTCNQSAFCFVGVSCFRQISIDKLTNRSADDEFSRSSVTKSLCCLSRLPLFGYIEVKLNIIVDKIFEHGNFDCDELLESSYNELNRCLSTRIQRNPDDSVFISSSNDFINDFYIETCLRELIILWRHKILILFKVLLLEKRILYYGSPVKPVCATILSVISLHPQLLNKGLCSDFEPKETTLTFDESQESPVKSVSSANNSLHDKSPGTEKSDDMNSVKHVTILPSEYDIIF